jgi:hypothetical protein
MLSRAWLSSRAKRGICFSFVAAFASHAAAAQATGAVSGVVTSAGKPLDRALVSLDSAREIRTDSLGNFRFLDVTAGPHELRVIAIGMNPIDHPVTIHAGREARLAIQMDKVTVLDSVQVKGNVDRLGLKREFDERRRLGIGVFVDSTRIRTYPYVRSALLDVQNVHTFKGSIRVGQLPGCLPNYWIDRVNWGRDEGMLKTLEPADIMAIEVYSRPLEIPPQFTSRSGGCGVIVIWTRRSW